MADDPDPFPYNVGSAEIRADRLLTIPGKLDDYNRNAVVHRLCRVFQDDLASMPLPSILCYCLMMEGYG